MLLLLWLNDASLFKRVYLIQGLELFYNSAQKVSKYGIFSGPYFPVFELNTGKYGPDKTPYLDTFYALEVLPGLPETSKMESFATVIND